MSNRTFLLIIIICTPLYSGQTELKGSEPAPPKRFTVKTFGGISYAGVGKWMTLGGKFNVDAGSNPFFGAALSYSITQPIALEFTVSRGIFERDEITRGFRNDWWHFTGRGTIYLNYFLQTYDIVERINPYISVGVGRLMADIEVFEVRELDFTVSTALAAAGFKYHLTETIDIYAGYEYHLANTNSMDGQPGRFDRNSWGSLLIGLSFNFGRKGSNHIIWHPGDPRVTRELERLEREAKTIRDLYRELEKKIEEYNQRITETEERLAALGRKFLAFQESFIIRLDADILFEFNSDRLHDHPKALLNTIADKLLEERSIGIRIIGHTDSIGPAEYNNRLSESRARSVANYLAERGVSKERMTIFGLGEREPITTNETVDGRRLNRRVEIEFLKLSR